MVKIQPSKKIWLINGNRSRTEKLKLLKAQIKYERIWKNMGAQLSKTKSLHTYSLTHFKPVFHFYIPWKS